MQRHEPAQRGMLLAEALYKGRAVGVAEIMRLLGCSYTTAKRYRRLALDTLPAVRIKGRGQRIALKGSSHGPVLPD